MTTYDLIIRNGTLVTPAGVRAADIGIAGEQIAAIEPELAGSSAATVEARGLHVFPGLIDAHIHFNEPGRTEWEGFASGTRALAAGGATAFFDMPLNSHPCTLDAANFDRKLAAAQAAAITDFALWGGLTPDNLDRLGELAACGAIGFKAFMSNSGIDDFQAVDDLTLYEGMAQAARLGRIVAVHAENDQITGALARRAVAQGRTGARDYLASRPAIAEIEAIARAILLAEATGCALHIVHVSTGRGVQLVAEARARGVDVSCETCPHYLVLTEDDLEALGAVAKCAPPLRPLAEQDLLWQHLQDGTLPMVASDHSPSPPTMKGLDRDGDKETRRQGASDDDHLPVSQSPSLLAPQPSFFQIWGGISGCQSTLQLLLTEGYMRDRLPLEMIASVTAGFVARRFGLAPQKGALAVGADADLALVDLGQSAQLAAGDLHYRHRLSPYVGRTLRGRVMQTLLRGAAIYREGTFVGAPRGRLLVPAAN